MIATDEAARSGLARLEQPVPAAGIALMRSVFGLVLASFTARFVLNGWVDELYVKPTYHFTYDAFQWLRPLPRAGMYSVFLGMWLAATTLCLGYRTQLSACVFGLLFSYVELLDKAAYLNHYYLVSLVCGLLTLVPSGERDLGFMTWGPGERNVPVISYLSLRTQLVVVYVFAGLAKLQSDWLQHGEPLYTWLQMFGDTPLIGGILTEHWFAVAASIFGAAFDLAVGPLLLWSRTRRVAYLLAWIFHGSIAWLFPVGAFSWVMLALDLVFFAPDGPLVMRAWLGRALPMGNSLPALSSAAIGDGRWPRVRGAMLTAHFLVQLTLPLRFLTYAGPVNWTEQGFRFAWRVMLIEKTGSVSFRVLGTEALSASDSGATLTQLQRQQMSTQPDMIHAYALHLRERYEAQGFHNVQVFADAWAALNGRPAERLVRPEVDLAALPRGTPVAAFVALPDFATTP